MSCSRRHPWFGDVLVVWRVPLYAVAAHECVASQPGFPSPTTKYDRIGQFATAIPWLLEVRSAYPSSEESV
jgi:hypothetical protein